LAQGGGADPAAAKLLQELERQDPEVGEEEDEEEEENEVDDLEDADQERRWENRITLVFDSVTYLGVVLTCCLSSKSFSDKILCAFLSPTC
jgi:hypothetical protein